MSHHRPIKWIQHEMLLLSHELSAALAFDDAVGLAYRERTGEELGDGGEYSLADRERAEEIMELYPPHEKAHT